MIYYFAIHGGPTDPEQVTREHVEMFLADFAQSHKPATVQTRYKALRIFFAFLLEDGSLQLAQCKT